jgi:hypothetical protein
MGKSSLPRRILIFISIVLFVLFLVAYPLFFDDDLHPSNIMSPLPYQKEWSISPPDKGQEEQVNSILSQPFFYLSEGGQSIVFMSADHSYVLKLFKFKRFRPSILINLLPDPFFHSYRTAHKTKRTKKLLAAFKGYKLAYDHLRQESGLIFIQLNPSSSVRLITLIDKRGLKRSINLQKATYIIQEKGEILSIALAHLLDKGELQKAQNLIQQLFLLYQSEYSKGLYDLDHGIMHNIGCVGDRLIHLDVGKIIDDEQMKQPNLYKKDLEKVALKISRWMSQHYPKYAEEMEQRMKEQLSAILDKKNSITNYSLCDSINYVLQ